MSRSTALLVAGALGVVVLPRCGAKTPITTWGYSHWYGRAGYGSEGEFERIREQCLAGAGISDPAAVTPGSTTEDAFVQCMNAENFCTTTYGCEKPGAS